MQKFLNICDITFHPPQLPAIFHTPDLNRTKNTK